VSLLGHRHEVARRVLMTLRALSSAAVSGTPTALQIFEGAAQTR
jgi:hypothetical protein